MQIEWKLLEHEILDLYGNILILFNINAAENKCITADSWLSTDIQNENSVGVMLQ